MALTTPPGNPNYPDAAGFEGIPISTEPVGVDTGTQYEYLHTIPSTSSGSVDYKVDCAYVDPGQFTQHTIAYDLYASPNIPENCADDQIIHVTCGVFAASTTGTVDGGGSTQDALRYMGGSNIVMDDGQSTKMYFGNNTNLYPHSRITEMKLRYRAWKNDGSTPSPSEGFEIVWGDDLAGSGSTPLEATISAWLVPDYQDNAVPTLRSIGETNPIPRAFSSTFGYASAYRLPFTQQDIENQVSGGGTTWIKFVALRGENPDAPLTETLYLDFVELVVTVVPERRYGVASRFFANTPVTAGSPSLYPLGTIPMQVWNPVSGSAIAGLSDSAIYYLATREALPPSPADYYHNFTSATRFSYCEAVGPSAQMYAYSTPRPSLDDQPRISIRPVLEGVPRPGLEEVEHRYPSLVAFDASRLATDGPIILGSIGLSYGSQLDFYSGSTGFNVGIKVNGSTTYSVVKLIVKYSGSPGNLSLSFQKPAATVLATCTITPADVAAGTPVGGGWVEVVKALSTPITPSAGNLLVLPTSTAALPSTWSIAVSRATTDSTTYRYNINTNRAIVVLTTPAVPTPTISTVTRALARHQCLTASVAHPRLSGITPAATSLRAIVIERSFRADHSDAHAIALVPLGATTWDDYSIPWDVSPVYYRCVVYRWYERVSWEGSWVQWAGAPAVNPGAAFGLTDPASGAGVVYAPVDPSDLNINWSPMDQQTIVQLHGIDYQVALRAPEIRGLSTQVQLLVDNIISCNETPVVVYDEPIVPGGKAMTPSPFDAIQALSRISPLVLQLPGGHTRWVALDLSGGLNIRTASATYIATAKLVDVLPPNVAPFCD